MAKTDLTAVRLHEILIYEPETGLFFRKLNSRRRPNTAIQTGTKTANGYISIHICEYFYTAHRLAWLYVYGKWPDGDIDHINGDRQDNRIENLRDVTRTINAQNRRTVGKNKINGLPLGVSFKRKNLAKPYCSVIYVNGEIIRLGYFEDSHSAHSAYLIAKRNMHDGCTI